MSESLFSLVLESKEITSKIIESGGEISPEIEKSLATVSDGLLKKVDNYAYFLDQIKHEQSYWKKKKEEFYNVEKSLKDFEKRLKEAIKAAMKDLKQDKIDGNDYYFRLQNTKPSIDLMEGLIPDQYKQEVVTIEIDRKRIEEDIAMGLEIPGALVTKNKSLRKYINKGKK